MKEGNDSGNSVNESSPNEARNFMRDKIKPNKQIHQLVNDFRINETPKITHIEATIARKLERPRILSVRKVEPDCTRSRTQ